jgi:hypothetical protein
MNSELNFFESEKILYSLWFVVRELHSEGERLKALYKKNLLDFSDLGNARGRWEKLEDLYTEKKILLEDYGLNVRQRETLKRISEKYSSVLENTLVPLGSSTKITFFSEGDFPNSEEEDEEDSREFEKYLVLVKRGERRG